MSVTPHPSVSRSPIASDAKNVPTACVLCSHNCGLRVDVEAGRISEVRGDTSNPISGGYLCNKGVTIGHYVNHSQRVTHPLRRRPDGSFEEVSWDTAIREIADRLTRIRDAHGPRAFSLIGVGGQGNHLDAGYALAFMTGLGSRRWFNAFAQEKTQNNLVDLWMADVSPSAFLHPDTEHASYLLVMGTNPRISNRGHAPTEMFKALAKDKERTVVVVDPRLTETARGADQHVRVKPGTDTFLLLGLTALVIQRKLHDASFIGRRTSGFLDARAALLEIDAAAMAERCDVPLDAMTVIAEEFSRAEGAAVFYDLGIEQGPFSTLNSYLIRLLLALTGNLGQRGGNTWIQSFNAPDPRQLETGETDKALVSGISAIRALGSYGMFSPSLFPEEVLNHHPERIRAAIVEGANPLLSFSDTARWREAVAALDLLVVIDPAMTETARLADYVLPTPVGYEKWEISMFPHSHPEIHAQLRPPVVAGPAEALPEAEIYARIAEAMGLFGEPPEALKALATQAGRPLGRAALVSAVMAVAAARRKDGRGVQNRVIFWLYRLLGPHLPGPSTMAVYLLCLKNALQRRRAVVRTLGSGWRWRSPFAIAEELWQRILTQPEGVEIARLADYDNLDEHIGYKDGRIRLAPAEMLTEIHRALAAPPLTSAEYPMTLAAGLRTRWTANTIQRDPSWRKGKGPHCPVALSSDDATRLGVKGGDAVVLSTRTGQVTLPAKVDKRLLVGHVSVPNGFGMQYDGADGTHVDGVNLNELTAADDRDPFTGCPHHKAVACRVDRAAPPWGP